MRVAVVHGGTLVPAQRERKRPLELTSPEPAALPEPMGSRVGSEARVQRIGGRCVRRWADPGSSGGVAPPAGAAIRGGCATGAPLGRAALALRLVATGALRARAPFGPLARAVPPDAPARMPARPRGHATRAAEGYNSSAAWRTKVLQPDSLTRSSPKAGERSVQVRGGATSARGRRCAPSAAVHRRAGRRLRRPGG